MKSITTNNRPLPLVPFCDLPVKVQKDFDYVSENDQYTNRFVKFKGAWYDAYDTMRIEKGSCSLDEFQDWDSYHGETFFSVVLFRFVDDEHVVCGHYFR